MWSQTFGVNNVAIRVLARLWLSTKHANPKAGPTCAFANELSVRVTLTTLGLPRCGGAPRDVVEAMHAAENVVGSCPPVHKWHRATLQRYDVGRTKPNL